VEPLPADDPLTKLDNVLLSPPDGVASNFTHTCVPEPGTLVLLLTAGIGLVLFAWRWRKRT
jgi:hypothetical protein